MTSSIETKRLHSTYYGGDVCCLYVIVRLRERDSGTLVNKENIDTFRYLHRIANQYNIHQRRWKRKHNAIQRTMMTSRMIGISRKSTSSLLTILLFTSLSTSGSTAWTNSPIVTHLLPIKESAAQLLLSNDVILSLWTKTS